MTGRGGRRVVAKRVVAESDSAGPDPKPEIWRLVHPRHGTLEVAVGKPAQLRTIDPGFPRKKQGADAGSAVDDDGEGSGDEGAAEESAAKASANPGFVVLCDGSVVARAHQIGNHKVSITGEAPERGKFTTNLSAVSGPRVQMSSSAFATAVRQVTFREGKEIVHFDPPPGSAAQARLEAIAASPWKRVLYPIAAGVGKSGWAIAMIVLLPLLGRLLNPVLDWIAERIPDFAIPWPEISPPSIPWPDIDLPSINLPEVTLPGWVQFLLEYSKVWIPLLIGVAIAVVAVRHSRRSRRIRQEWQAEQAGQAGQAWQVGQVEEAEQTGQAERLGAEAKDVDRDESD